MSLSRFTANIIYIAYHKKFKWSNGEWYYLNSSMNQWVKDSGAVTLKIKLSTTVWKSFHNEGIRFAQNTKVAGDFNEHNQIFMLSIAEKLSDTSFKRSVIDECQELFYQMPNKSTVRSKKTDLMAPLVKRMRHNDPDCDTDSDSDSDQEPKVTVTKLQPTAQPQQPIKTNSKRTLSGEKKIHKTVHIPISTASTSTASTFLNPPLPTINLVVNPATTPLLFQGLPKKTSSKRKLPEKSLDDLDTLRKSKSSSLVNNPPKKKTVNNFEIQEFELPFVNYLNCIPLTRENWQTVGKLLVEINPNLFTVWSNWCNEFGKNIIPELTKITMFLSVWWFKRTQELDNENKPASYFRKKKLKLQKLAYCSNSEKYDELEIGEKVYKSIQKHIFGQEDPSKTQIAKVIKSKYKTDFVFDSSKNQWHKINKLNTKLTNINEEFEHNLIADLKTMLNGIAYRKREWRNEVDDNWAVLQIVQRNLQFRSKFVLGVLKKVRKLLSNSK